jgi:hypothetical protein
VSLTAAVYRPRNPQLSDYYRCVEDYFETFVQIYGDQFSRQYGFWRPYLDRDLYYRKITIHVIPVETGIQNLRVLTGCRVKPGMTEKSIFQ